MFATTAPVPAKIDSLRPACRFIVELKHERSLAELREMVRISAMERQQRVSWLKDEFSLAQNLVAPLVANRIAEKKA